MPITPGLNLPFGIQPVNPVPVDSFYGPYANVAQAKASVPLALRYDGITVQITGSGNYWWLAADLSDTGLVPKIGGGGYEPDYITIGLNTAGELISLVGGSSGLPSVLAIDNTTGANNISIDSNQLIVSGNGGGQLALDYGATSSKVVLSNDSGTASGSWLKLESGAGTQAGLFWNDGVNVPSLITIDDTDGIMIRMNDAFIQIDHGGGPLGPSIYMEGDWLTINVSDHIMTTAGNATWNIGQDYILTAVNSVALTAQGSDLTLDATGLGANIVLTPADRVIINTALQYLDGNQALSKVLTSDALGNATWQLPSGGNPPDNVTIILNTAGELVVANPYPGLQGLTSVLTVDNSTTGYDIVLTDTDQITSSSLSAALTLDDGFYGTSLSSDGFDYGTAWVYSTGSYDIIWEWDIKNHVEIAAVDVDASNRARTVQYTTKGAIDAWTALDYLNIESRASITLAKYDWTLDDWQGGLMYSAGGGYGSGWEFYTTEVHQKGLNIVNDLAFYLDGGENIDIDAAVDKVLVTKGWVLANAGVGYPPDNVTIILNTAGELTAVGAGAAGLPTVLGIDNTTGANDISIDSTQKLTSTDGVNTIDLAFNGGIALWSNLVPTQFESIITLLSTDSIESQLIAQTRDIVSGKYSKLASHTTTEYGAINEIILESFTGGEGLYTRLTISEQGNTIEDQINEMGISYAADYSVANSIPNNPRWLPDKDYVDTAISNVAVQIISPDDKFLTSNDTVVDGELATASTITNTPVDGCYVEVKYNGAEYEVGNGVITKDFYFSGDGGVNARGFLASHPNGQVQAGDQLYFNSAIAGFRLSSGNRISLMYLVTI